MQLCCRCPALRMITLSSSTASILLHSHTPLRATSTHFSSGWTLDCYSSYYTLLTHTVVLCLSSLFRFFPLFCPSGCLSLLFLYILASNLPSLHSAPSFSFLSCELHVYFLKQVVLQPHSSRLRSSVCLCAFSPDVLPPHPKSMIEGELFMINWPCVWMSVWMYVHGALKRTSIPAMLYCLYMLQCDSDQDKAITKYKWIMLFKVLTAWW